ncbi:MAG: hypothetical protein KDC32_25825, partial [Saprospiraceae bacterium]|nr:hypothetical protein [Saprospiraceae bacterium]
LIDPQVAADPEVSAARSVILPAQIGSADPTGGTNGLQNFAQQFEAVFAEQKLKIATGINRSDLNTSKKARDIWVVDMDAFSTTVEATAPKYYALKPLSTKLESLQGANVYTYSSASGLDMNTALYQNFSAIDMDDWARQFLEAVDQVLSPKMATAAFLVDQIVGTAHLSALTDAKKALAGSIVQFLSPIYDGVTFSDIEMEAAREKLQQQLLIRLSNANLINTVVQFPVTITSELAGGRRLYGKPFVQAAGNSGDRNFAFSTAKIDLGANDPLLTFLFDTKHDEASATVDFDLELRITHLEHEIEAHETDNLSGYESSSWLAFVNFDDQLRKDLGHVDIPVPLRAYPTPPGLQRQAAVQSTAEPGKSDLQNATQWDYRVTYLQQTAAQDRIKAQIALNRQPPPATASAMMAGGRSLLEELATFLYHFPAIQSELVANLSLITAQTAPDDAAVLAAERAMNAFVTLVIALSEAWPYWAPGQNSVTTVELVGDIHFDLTLEEGSQDDTDDGLLEIEVAPIAIDPAEIVLATPKVEVSGDLGANLSGTDVARYQYGLTFKQAKGITERTLILEDLNILDYQNAIMKISVSRNEQLSPGEPTDPDFMTTNPDFIYRTSEIQFPNHLVPLLDNEIGIDMAEEVLGENQPLEAYLSKFLEKLLFRQEGDVQTLKLSCSYVYSIHPSGDPDLAAEERTFEIALPILLIPPYELQIKADLDPADPASFVAILAGGIRSWYQNHLPAGGNLNERFLFDLAVFSKMNASILPILRLRNVYLRRDSVSDL